MKRREFLQYLAAGTLAGGCGRYLPEDDLMEVSIPGFQPRAAQVEITQILWKAVDLFREKHPEIRIEPASGGGGGYEELMIRVMEGNPPDIMSFAGGDTGLVYSYIEQGHVLDLSEYLQWPSYDTPGASWLETIDPLYHEALTYNGRFYAIPLTVYTLQFYCNKALYERAGADPNPPTWDCFLDNCERLKRIGVAPITQDGIHWYTSWWFDHLALRLLGPEKVRQALRDPERRTKWTEPGFIQAARMVGELLDREYFVAGFSGLNHIESELLFWQGQAATLFVGNWLTSARKEIMGDDFRLYAFPFPGVEGGQGSPHALMGYAGALSIPTRARHPELAADFLRLLDSRWFQEQMVQQVLRVSPLSSVSFPPVHQGLDLILKNKDSFYPFSFGLEGAHPFLYRQYWDEWNRFMVAREISAEQLVGGLEDIFTRYFQTVELSPASML
ncbi:MAG: extracellular solute-binding protein [Candidatus Latescibacteria bacterium]|nr:extracellular solute-binding protein [Candidatus Latescibacterota bacterium]